MKCVILGAGEGKRMRPLTSTIPKVMIPLANRPMVEHLIEAVRDSGITEILLVVGYGEERVRGYFGDGTRWGVSLRYVTQRHQRGTADALRSVDGLIRDRFLLLNGDMILKKTDLAGLVKAESPCVATYHSDRPEEYGTLTVENDRITSLHEKVARPPSDLINAGAYVLDSDIFGILKTLPLSERGEYELTDALRAYIERNELRAHSLGYWCDVGYPWDLLDANAALLADMEPQRVGTIEEQVTLQGRVSIGEGTVVRSGTYIEGPCIIGKNCRIGPHTYIRGSTAIGDSCHIGHCTEVKNSIILEHTNAPHFNYIGDSVIGRGCNLGAGTKIANLRHDRAVVRIGSKDTHRVKFGAIIGDGVQFGINCSVNVGSIVGSDSRFAPATLVDGLYGDKSKIR
ncbi:MAG: NTP transferase domain-containing protein [Methanomicrobiales archaeon]|nr:NTP transferase domain-containing protein [Methanomicrobiales archaeon]